MAKRVLEGIKVADFTWAVVGPWATKILANAGATVVKIESMTKVCVTRTFAIKAGGPRSVNRSPITTAYNDTKYSMALNLSLPQGREVAKRMVEWSDIVVENFMPTTMEKWGLGYDDLKKVKSNIIMVRLCAHGQTGPSAVRPGLGTQLQAECGFVHFLGYPDGDALAHVGYSDFCTPPYAVISIFGALNYRRKTGKGMCIDIAQYEPGVRFLGPTLLDYTANKRNNARMGNRHLEAVPHGAYRCKGDDRWCVIAVFNDDEWGALAMVMDMPELTTDSRFNSQAMRKQNEDELERIVEAWTVNYSPEEVMTKLQVVGVAAGIVQNGRDLYADPQLAHRQHFKWIPHAEIGLVAYDSPSYRFSKTPSQFWTFPCLGEHTEYVCREFLGMSDEEFVELLAAGVFE